MTVCCYCSLSPKRGSRSPAKNNRRKPITGARSRSPALSSSPPHKTAREINSLSPRGDGRSRSPTPPRRRNARVSRSLSPRNRSLSPGRQAGNGKSGANVRSPGVDAGPDSPRVEHEVSHLHDNDRSHKLSFQASRKTVVHGVGSVFSVTVSIYDHEWVVLESRLKYAPL